MRTLAPALVALSLLLAAGCRGREGEVIVEEIVVPPPPLPPSPPAGSDRPDPVPSPTPTPSAVAGSPPASPGPVASQRPGRPRRHTLSVQVDWPDVHIPRLMMELTSPSHPESIVDWVSEEGHGLNGRFRELEPGSWVLKLKHPLLPDVPLVTRSLRLEEDRTETFHPTVVRFDIPAERSYEVAGQIAITVIEEPARRPIVSRLLAEVRTETLTGTPLERTLLLPPGRYSYIVEDRGSDPTIGFSGIPDGMEPVVSNNEFTLSEKSPRAAVDLTGLIRTRALPPGRPSDPGAGTGTPPAPGP